MKLNKEPETETITKNLTKTQDEWIKYWNRNKDKFFPSAADLYKCFKKLGKKDIESLRKDFESSWLMTSTRIFYEKDSLNATITHNFKCKKIKSKSTKLMIPELWNEPISNVNLNFLQVLFGTKDSRGQIIKVLEKISGKKSKDIIIWTLDKSWRKDYPERAVSFDYSSGRFRINGLNFLSDLNYNGRSRGCTFCEEGNK